MFITNDVVHTYDFVLLGVTVVKGLQSRSVFLRWNAFHLILPGTVCACVRAPGQCLLGHG